MTRIFQGKTVYLAKITDEFVTKVNKLQLAPFSTVLITFSNWQHFSTRPPGFSWARIRADWRASRIR